MMFWSVYIFAALAFSHLLAKFTVKYYPLFTLIFVFLATPAQIDAENMNYSPSTFTFFYNVILEKDFSFRVLRPLTLSLPFSLVIITSIFFIKKRFF